jgi:hypothetical protein
MENRYHHKLRLPVKFVPKKFEFKNNPNYIHVLMDPTEVNQELKDFLKSIGVSIRAVEVFGRTPNTENKIHIDGDRYTDSVKINFVYGQGDMDWYDLKPGRKLVHGISATNTPHIVAEDEDCTKVWSASIDDSGSLVNVGGLHGLSNIATTRWCYCLMLGDIANNDQRLQWDRAVELFKGYYG